MCGREARYSPSETFAEKPTFRAVFDERACPENPASGFGEDQTRHPCGTGARFRSRGRAKGNHMTSNRSTRPHAVACLQCKKGLDWTRSSRSGSFFWVGSLSYELPCPPSSAPLRRGCPCPLSGAGLSYSGPKKWRNV
jgi:hypothetical protein